MKKKYQVFISSTYEDLTEVRNNATKEILKMGHIPIGMEMFNPDNTEQWRQIRECIDTSDYYIVIVGNKYGSLTRNGISYTEKEYNYALKRKIPIIRFIIDDKAPISLDRCESDVRKLEKLQNFKHRLKRYPVSFWNTPDDFSTKLVQALSSYIETYPRIGWVHDDIFVESNELISLGLDEYARKAIGAIKTSIENKVYYDFYNRIITIEIDDKSNNFIITVSNDILIKNIDIKKVLYCPRPCFADEKYANSYTHEIFEINRENCIDLISMSVESGSKNKQLPYMVKNTIDYSKFKDEKELHIFHKFSFLRPMPYFYTAYQITLPCKNFQATAKIQNNLKSKFKIMGFTASNYRSQKENDWKAEIYTDPYQCTVNFGEWAPPGSGFMFYIVENER